MVPHNESLDKQNKNRLVGVGRCHEQIISAEMVVPSSHSGCRKREGDFDGAVENGVD